MTQRASGPTRRRFRRHPAQRRPLGHRLESPADRRRATEHRRHRPLAHGALRAGYSAVDEVVTGGGAEKIRQIFDSFETLFGG